MMSPEEIFLAIPLSKDVVKRYVDTLEQVQSFIILVNLHLDDNTHRCL